MLIVSKHRDYYDKVTGTVGVDKTLVYKRDLIKLEKPIRIILQYSFPTNSPYSNNYTEYTKDKPAYTPFLIGFCGKLYVGYKFQWEDTLSDIQKTLIIYNKERIISLVTSKIKSNRITVLTRQIEDIFKHIDGRPFNEIFVERHVPYFYGHFKQNWMGRNSEFIVDELNSILENYEFVKKFDPFMAFQEVSMYLGGVLGTNEKETIEIDEKYRQLKHGFDKMSFRQVAPGQKKEQRRLNKLRKSVKK